MKHASFIRPTLGLVSLFALAFAGCDSGGDGGASGKVASGGAGGNIVGSGATGGVGGASGSGGTGAAGSGGAGGSTGGAGGAAGTFTLPTGCASGWTVHCNPLTNEGCANGDACDLTQSNGIECFAAPNDAQLGQACDINSGPTCTGTTFCIGDSATGPQTCHRFCCASSDCPGGGTCRPLDSSGTLGACIGGATDGGATDGGSDGGTDAGDGSSETSTDATSDAPAETAADTSTDSATSDSASDSGSD